MSDKNNSNSKARLAIIGCGAVTKLCHLPAVELTKDIEIVALVDKDITRVKSLSEKYNINNYFTDIHQLPENIDGIINALPNHLHAPVSIEFLKRGISVLTEKPMALSLNEAESMVKAAEENDAILQVGFMYRFCNGARVVKHFIDKGLLGKLQNFSLESGFIYDWPISSGFILNKEQAGGGELMDIGSHMLDLLLWWIGDVLDVKYKDDSQGNLEAECELSLVLQNSTGPVKGDVTLSRLRNLNDKARIVGDQFMIEFDLSTWDKVSIWPTSNEINNLTFVSEFGTPTPQSWKEVYANQMQSFVNAIIYGKQIEVSGKSVLNRVALIEQCYRERQAIELTWM